MSKIVIDFKHEDVHQPRPWPVAITDDIVTSGLGQDDGAVLIGFALAGSQTLAYMPEEIERIDFEAEDFVPVFSADNRFFNWSIPIRGIRIIEEATLDAGSREQVGIRGEAVRRWDQPVGQVRCGSRCFTGNHVRPSVRPRDARARHPPTRR